MKTLNETFTDREHKVMLRIKHDFEKRKKLDKKVSWHDLIYYALTQGIHS